MTSNEKLLARLSPALQCKHISRYECLPYPQTDDWNFVLVLFAFVVLRLVPSVQRQEIG